MAVSVQDILIKVIPLYEQGGFRSVRDDIQDLEGDTKAASVAARDLGRELTKVEKKDLALAYDSAAADAVLADLKDIDARLEKIAKRRLGVDPSVKQQANILRGVIQDRQNDLEQNTKLFKRLQEEEVAAVQESADRRVKIEKLAEKEKQGTLTSGHKSFLTRLRNEETAALASAEVRRRQTTVNAPDLFGSLRGASRDIGVVGRSLNQASEAADNWGSRLAGLSTVLTRISPILRGVSILIGITLVTAITAVVASLAAAVGAIGALATSMVAVLGPVVAVVLGFFKRLAEVTKVLALRQNVLKAANRVSSDATKASAAQAEKLASARETLRDATQAGVTAERQLAEATKQARAEIERAAAAQIDAARNLTEANQDLKRATVDAYRAIRDAAEEASDAVRDLEGAQLDLEGARLDFKDAKDAVKDFRAEAGLLGSSFDNIFKKFEDVDVDLSDLLPDLKGAGAELGGDEGQSLERLVHNMREARHREQEAIDGVSDAETDLSDKRTESKRLQREGISGVDSYRGAVERQRDATQELATATEESNELQKLGIEGAPAVIAAHDAVRDAKEREATAIRNLKSVRKGEAEGLTALNHAMDDYQRAFGLLSPAEQDFVTSMAKLMPAFKGIVQEGTDPIFESLTKAIPQLEKFSPLLRNTFSGLGKSIGEGITNFLDLLSDPVTLVNLGTIAGAAQRMLDTFNQKIVGDAFTAFINIAVAALPVLEKAFNGAAGMLEKFSKATQGMDSKKGNFGLMVTSLETIWDLVKNVGVAFGLFIRDAAGPGNEFVGFLAKGAKHLGDWLKSKKGREQLQKFFRETLPFAKAAVKFVGKLTVFLLKVFQFVAPMAADFLNGLTDILSFFEKILDLLNQIPTWGRRILGILAPVFLAWRGIWATGTVGIAGFRVAIGLVISVVSAIGAAFSSVGDDIEDFVDGAIEWFHTLVRKIKEFLQIGSPSKVFIEIGKDVMRGLVAGIRAGVQWVTDKAREVAGKFIDGVKAGFARAKGVGGSVATAIGNGIRSAWEKLRSVGGTVINAVVSGLRAARDKAVGAGLWIYNRIKEGIGAVYEKFLSVGKGVLNAITDGIKDHAGLQRVLDAITGVINAVIGTVKRLLDIHSPSGVFRSIGMNVVAGFIEGIKGANLYSFMEGHFGRRMWERAANAMKGGGGLFDMLPMPRALRQFLTQQQRFTLAGPGEGGIGKLLRHLKLENLPHFGKKRLVEEHAPDLSGSLKSGLFKLGTSGLAKVREEVREKLLKELGVRGLAEGGLVTGPTLRMVGEGATSEVVLPLSQSVMRDLARSITAQMQGPSPVLAGVGGAREGGRGQAGMYIENQTVMLPPAAGHDQMGDPRHQAVQFARELKRRGGDYGVGGGGV